MRAKQKKTNCEAITSFFFHSACNNEQLAFFELSLLLHQVSTSHLILRKKINYKIITSIFLTMPTKMNNYHYDDKSIRCHHQCRHHAL
jgi:hypothetical protein